MNTEPDGIVAYNLAIRSPNKNDPNWPVPSFDASDWAEAFCKQYPDIPEDVMVGWFANALMRGFDQAFIQSKVENAEFGETK